MRKRCGVCITAIKMAARIGPIGPLFGVKGEVCQKQLKRQQKKSKNWQELAFLETVTRPESRIAGRRT